MIATSFAVLALVAQPLVALNVPSAFALGGDTYIVGTGYDSDCSDKICNSIQAAIDAAVPGDTIKLASNFDVTTQITVNKAIALDGNGKTLWGQFDKPAGTAGNSNNSIIGLQAAATIQNITLDAAPGFTTYRHKLHGINAWHTNGDATVWDVTLNDMGMSGLNVGEQARVVAGNLHTSNNAWDAIDLDKTGSWLKIGGINHFNENAGIPVLYIDVVGTPAGLVIDSANLYATRDNYKQAGDRAYFLKNPAVTNLTAKFSGDSSNLIENQWLNVKTKAGNTSWPVLNFDAPAGVNVDRYKTVETRPDGTSEVISNQYHNTWLNRGNPPASVTDSRAEFGMHGDGTYTYTVYYTDLYNGTKSEEASYRLRYDGIAPTVTIDSPVNYVNTSKPFTISGTYKDQGVNGYDVESGVGRLHLYVSANGNTVAQPFIIPASQLNQISGAYNYTLTLADVAKLLNELHLTDGQQFTVKALVYDNANNSNYYSPSVKTFTADNTAPVVTGLKITQNNNNVTGKVINQRYITVKWDASTDPNFDYFEYHNRNGWHNLGSDTSFSGNIGPAVNPDGAYTYKVRAYDKAGNVSAEQSVTVTLDTTPPTTTVSLDRLLNPTQATVTISDINSQGKYAINVLGTNGTTGNSRLCGLSDFAAGAASAVCGISGLADGQYYLRANVLDAAGNNSASVMAGGAAISNVFTIDTTPPPAPAASFEPNTDGTQKVELEDVEAGVSIYYTVDGTTPTTSSTSYNGAFNITPVVAPSVLTIKAIAVDAAGNVSSVYTVAGPSITNQASQTATTNAITLVWTTGTPATSRVVYDTVPHAVLGSDANYGYAFSTGEDTTKTTNHSVTITGLTPGTTYYFRIVSHGSPTTVSPEITSLTLNEQLTRQNGTPTFQVNTPQGDGVVAVAQNGDGAVLGTETGADNNAKNDPDTNTTSDKDVKGAEDVKGDDATSPLGVAWYWWVLALAAVATGIWWLIAARKRRKDEDK